MENPNSYLSHNLSSQWHNEANGNAVKTEKPRFSVCRFAANWEKKKPETKNLKTWVMGFNWVFIGLARVCCVKQ